MGSVLCSGFAWIWCLPLSAWPESLHRPQWLYVIVLTAISLVVTGPQNALSSEADDGVPVCEPLRRMCSSILRINNIDEEDRKNLVEGPLCHCSSDSPAGHNCSESQWVDPDDLDSLDRTGSFTWVHHQRGDWIVQYKFCNIINYDSLDVCENDEEVMAKVVTDGDTWNPVLVHGSPRCRCPRPIYHHMDGWKLNQTDKSKSKGEWEYSYTCSKPVCRTDQACVRRYVDNSGTVTHGYKFQCKCRDGFLCPMGTSGKPKQMDTQEDSGNERYIQHFCEKIPGWKDDGVKTSNT